MQCGVFLVHCVDAPSSQLPLLQSKGPVFCAAPWAPWDYLQESFGAKKPLPRGIQSPILRCSRGDLLFNLTIFQEIERLLFAFNLEALLDVHHAMPCFLDQVAKVEYQVGTGRPSRRSDSMGANVYLLTTLGLSLDLSLQNKLDMPTKQPSPAGTWRRFFSLELDRESCSVTRSTRPPFCCMSVSRGLLFIKDSHPQEKLKVPPFSR